MPGKKEGGTAGNVSGGGSFLWTRRGAWCLVFGKEDRRSWRGSLVSGERRRLMKEVLVLSRERDGEKKAWSVSGAIDGEDGGSWTKRSLHLGKSIGVKN